jgi:hypothetical protein
MARIAAAIQIPFGLGYSINPPGLLDGDGLDEIHHVIELVLLGLDP